MSSAAGGDVGKAAGIWKHSNVAVKQNERRQNSEATMFFVRKSKQLQRQILLLLVTYL